jgi:hypothetical protein
MNLRMWSGFISPSTRSSVGLLSSCYGGFFSQGSGLDTVPLPKIDRDRLAHIQSQYQLNTSVYLSRMFQMKATDHNRIY